TSEAAEEACEGTTANFGKIKSTGCGTCTNLLGIATAVMSFMDGDSGKIYCAEGLPFGGDDSGNVPPDSPKGPITKCENRIGKGAAKLAAAILRCHVRRAGGKLAS